VGVSATARQNHVPNKAALLTALAAEGYAKLETYILRGIEDTADRDARRNAALLGYVAFAQDHPALHELIFARERGSSSDPELLRHVRACFAILAENSKDFGRFDGNAEKAAARLQMFLWSLVHGYSQLLTANRSKKACWENTSSIFSPICAPESRHLWISQQQTCRTHPRHSPQASRTSALCTASSTRMIRVWNTGTTSPEVGSEPDPPNCRGTPVDARGRGAARPPYAYDVHDGSVPDSGAPEEIVECPSTQPPRPRGIGPGRRADVEPGAGPETTPPMRAAGLAFLSGELVA
jgi:AcrR family transcriptional regulator